MSVAYGPLPQINNNNERMSFSVNQLR